MTAQRIRFATVRAASTALSRSSWVVPTAITVTVRWSTRAATRTPRASASSLRTVNRTEIVSSAPVSAEESSSAGPEPAETQPRTAVVSLAKARRAVGTRVKSRTVALMTHNQSGLLHNGPRQGWGLAFETTEQIGGNGLEPVGGYGWGGAYGSIYRVDPSAGLVLTLMLNQIPNGTDIRTKFQTLVYQAVQ